MMIDILNEFRKIQSANNNETFDRSTDSLEALRNYIAGSLEGSVDGVYFDEVLGVAGTAWPIGTPANPVNNLADAITIMAARNLTKLYLAGTGVHAITLTTGLNLQIVGNLAYTITIAPAAIVYIASDLDCLQLISTTGQVGIGGNLRAAFDVTNTTGAMVVEGNAYIDGNLTNTTGTINIHGNCYTSGGIINTNIGGISIDGKCETNTVTNSGGGDVTFNGGLYCYGGFNNTGGDDVGIRGGCYIGGALTMTTALSAFLCYGDVHIGEIFFSSTGDLTIYGNVHIDNGLANTGAGNVAIHGNLQVNTSLTNTSTGTVVVQGDTLVSAGHVLNSGGGDLTFDGTLDINGNPSAAEGYLNNTGGDDIIITSHIRCNYITNTTGDIIVFGDVKTYGSLTNTTGTVTIGGNAEISGAYSSTTGVVIVYGNMYVRSTTTVSGAAGTLTVYGDGVFIGALGATNATSVITIMRTACIIGAITATGTITYNPCSHTKLNMMHGGLESLESLDDELDAMLDLAQVRTLASPVTLTAAVQYVYSNSPGTPFYFAGGFMNRASGAWATGEMVTITVDAMIDGTNWRNLWTTTINAEPSPVLLAVPSYADPLLLNVPIGFYNNGGGVRVGIVQTVEGAAFHTWNHSFLDGVRST